MGDPRYRCDGCGNLTRFDVTTSRRTKAFHHYTVGGELHVDEETVLSHHVDEVVCRWCGHGRSVVELEEGDLQGGDHEGGDLVGTNPGEVSETLLVAKGVSPPRVGADGGDGAPGGGDDREHQEPGAPSTVR
jgi:hypothetical protein